jgi:hypothetical protein
MTRIMNKAEADRGIFILALKGVNCGYVIIPQTVAITFGHTIRNAVLVCRFLKHNVAVERRRRLPCIIRIRHDGHA